MLVTDGDARRAGVTRTRRPAVCQTILGGNGTVNVYGRDDRCVSFSYVFVKKDYSVYIVVYSATFIYTGWQFIFCCMCCVL